jgi:hypothetical protein
LLLIVYMVATILLVLLHSLDNCAYITFELLVIHF